MNSILSSPTLNGLILSGGLSTRMGQDKGTLIYPRSNSYLEDQRSHCYRLLRKFCSEVFISCRSDQKNAVAPELPVILDRMALGEGPGIGMLSAFETARDRAWFVLACDFPYAKQSDIQYLCDRRNHQKAATLYKNRKDVLEPFFAIWEPSALEHLESQFRMGHYSPRRALEQLNCEGVTPLMDQHLHNINTLEERALYPTSKPM